MPCGVSAFPASVFSLADAAVEIARAISRTRPDGVVLDLRDNIGGMTRYGGQVAELFISGEFHGCRKRTQLSRGIDIASGSQFMRMTRDELARLDGAEAPQRCIDMLHGRSWEEYMDTYGAPGHAALYDGPCVLLASRRTVSAAEDTLAFFRSNHRAAVVGEPTCGTTGTPLLLRMPGGGSARVCAVGYRLLDGTAFIGRGIAPDILLPATREDLSRGEDAQLDRALTLLEGGTVTA
jgi:carboxyl-terminal processing protease